MSLLFALDTDKKEVIVSTSAKGSNTIQQLERIAQHDNELLYQAVETLTQITKAPKLDAALFKAMDKVCQLMYAKHKEQA
jgi:hypothetical protein